MGVVPLSVGQEPSPQTNLLEYEEDVTLFLCSGDRHQPFRTNARQFDLPGLDRDRLGLAPYYSDNVVWSG